MKRLTSVAAFAAFGKMDSATHGLNTLVQLAIVYAD